MGWAKSKRGYDLLTSVSLKIDAIIHYLVISTPHGLYATFSSYRNICFRLRGANFRIHKVQESWYLPKNLGVKFIITDVHQTKNIIIWNQMSHQFSFQNNLFSFQLFQSVSLKWHQPGGRNANRLGEKGRKAQFPSMHIVRCAHKRQERWKWNGW